VDDEGNPDCRRYAVSRKNEDHQFDEAFAMVRRCADGERGGAQLLLSEGVRNSGGDRPRPFGSSLPVCHGADV